MGLDDVLASFETGITDLLKSLAQVNFGDRVRINQLRPPVIWILPADSPVEFSGQAEFWTYRFVLAAVTKGTDPQKGSREAVSLASRASMVLVRSRTLGGRVRDVRRVQYLPGDIRGMGAEQLYSAGFMMEMRFRYLEEST